MERHAMSLVKTCYGNDISYSVGLKLRMQFGDSQGFDPLTVLECHVDTVGHIWSKCCKLYVVSLHTSL